ncbi:MAG: DUF1360 domain-containing protein [Desulfobulbaceae bacterium]|nr:DUF1360 domain-containing protein [Pseudomonadota bacterium]MCG2746990.1 DUF1360 domain-containing protein [Desulfobulbaceae bacterium]
MVERVVLLSIVTASLSYNITETKIFNPFREWLKGKNAFMGKLFSCGYCLGHWIEFALVLIYRVKLFSAWSPMDYFSPLW